MSEPHTDIILEEDRRPIVIRRWGAAWAVAAVFIVGMLIAGIPIVYLIISWGNAARAAPGKMGDAISRLAADAVQPRINVREIVVSGIEDLKRQNKLVVLTTVVSADVTREEGSSSWMVYWGTNVARVAVRDAHVQYTIDLSTLATSDFIFDPDTKTLHVTLPRPTLDLQMVSIDPSKIETLDLRGGWARLDKRDTWDHAVAELKPKVIVEASRPFIRRQAEDAGRKDIAQLLQPLAAALTPGAPPAKLDISYR